MKGCELCGRAAKMYCESDSASLCWDCDEKVHGANFLVAKHCRTLLCQVCQSSTPWKASGTKLRSAVSVCESCVVQKNRQEREGSSEGTGESQGPSDPESADEDDETDESDFDHSDSEDEVEEDGENQVVPWSGETPPPPVVSSSSSEGDISSGFVGNGSGLKRTRENTDLDSEDEIGHSSSPGGYGGESGQFESKSAAIVSSLKRIQRDVVSGGDSASETAVRIRNLSRDQDR
ncbi:zinc finger protein CONSTANS-LIKE 2-like [Tripterygium wilfordii]|uniref:zinc finger protein CONSTANS-LIKE 2-like n=1 Tax=Tripterygium wilfordii TaxID=458696 RepID=UPI0018F8635B|nr:zinc finger protein CONSTANS-LIKE 2-like [Tripterygium wilfordii]